MEKVKSVFTRSCTLEKVLQLLSKRALDKIITREFQASFKEVDDCENLFVYMPMNQIGFDFKISKKETWKFMSMTEA